MSARTSGKGRKPPPKRPLRRRVKHKAERTIDPEHLLARLADLDQRINLLEARLRQVASRAERRGSPPRFGGERLERARARCPGCHLELPKGPRGEQCVWCGFYFAGLRLRAAK